MTRLGRSTLGLSYGMALTDLILAPATPSNTARCGGVVFPVVASLSRLEDSHPEPEESRMSRATFVLLLVLRCLGDTPSIDATTAAFAILTLVYFYSHYLFASNTAHVVAMYAVFGFIGPPVRRAGALLVGTAVGGAWMNLIGIW